MPGRSVSIRKKQHFTGSMFIPLSRIWISQTQSCVVRIERDRFSFLTTASPISSGDKTVNSHLGSRRAGGFRRRAKLIAVNDAEGVLPAPYRYCGRHRTSGGDSGGLQ